MITSLAAYSETRQLISSSHRIFDHHHQAAGQPNSLLFLQVFAAADYFSSNKKFMQNVPPVNVDISELETISNENVGDLIVCIVLDPFLLNIFPTSLLPTGVYLIILAILAWFLSGYICRGLYQLSRIDEKQHAALDAPEAGQSSKKIN